MGMAIQYSHFTHFISKLLGLLSGDQMIGDEMCKVGESVVLTSGVDNSRWRAESGLAISTWRTSGIQWGLEFKAHRCFYGNIKLY